MSLSLEVSYFRFAVYDLFSSLFVYNFYDEDYNALLKKLDDVSQVETDAVDLKAIRDAVKSVPKGELLIEYTTLFMTGTGFKPLVPVESKRLYSILGENAAWKNYNDVLRFYRRRGIEVNYMLGQFTPEPDHIASELAFMAYLIREEIKARKEGKLDWQLVEDQKNFFISHIYSWVPDWANDVVNDPRSNVYKVVCRELRKWLDLERKVVQGGER